MKQVLQLSFAVLFTAAVAAGCGGADRAENAPRAGADSTAARTPAGESEAAPDAVRAVLRRQAEAWNRGDLRGFMAGYAQTDTLRFASGGAVWRGWETTLQRYRQTYPDEGTMGRLAFDSVDVRVLSPGYAFAFGRWSLQRSENYADVSGLFTLLLEHRPEGWRIVHDHTSSAAAE